MFSKTDKDSGFPKSIRDALNEYDRKKGPRRSVFGEQAAVKALRALPLDKRRDMDAIMKCFEGKIINEKQASYGVYQACCNLIIGNSHEESPKPKAENKSDHNHKRTNRESAPELVASKPPVTTKQRKVELVSFINDETLMEVKKIWERHKKEKHVCSIMQSPDSYSNKLHAQQDHDYYTGLIKDRIKSNALFCSDKDAQKQAFEVIERLTSSPLKEAKVFQHMTVSQLLFLLDHAANHRATPDREKAACALYTALSQLPVHKDPDLNPLVRALAGYHPDVSAENNRSNDKMKP